MTAGNLANPRPRQRGEDDVAGIALADEASKIGMGHRNREERT
jgi:hypothetical protein